MRCRDDSGWERRALGVTLKKELNSRSEMRTGMFAARRFGRVYVAGYYFWSLVYEK